MLVRIENKQTLRHIIFDVSQRLLRNTISAVGMVEVMKIHITARLSTVLPLKKAYSARFSTEGRLRDHGGRPSDGTLPIHEGAIPF